MRSPTLLVVMSSAVALMTGVFGCSPVSESDPMRTDTAPLAGSMPTLGSDPERDRSSKADQAAREGVLDGDDVKEPTLMDELGALRREVLLLRADLSGVRNRVQQLEQSENRSTSDEDAQTIESPEEVFAARTEAAQRAEDRLGAIEAAFLGEPTDRSWSADTSMAIDEALQSEQLRGTNVRSVECRSTMCRVEVAHDDPRKRMEFGLWLPAKLGGVLPTFITKEVDEGEGVTGSILFLVRLDHQLPLS